MAYRLFLSYLVLTGAVLPVSYLIVVEQFLSTQHFSLRMFSSGAFAEGNWYTFCATAIFLFVAYTNRPLVVTDIHIRTQIAIYRRYASLLFIFAVVCSSITIVLSLMYGMSASNLTAQRPPLAVYAGYIARILFFAGPVFLAYQITLFGKLSPRGWLVLILILLDMAVAHSRSGLMSLLFLFLFCTAYSPVKFKVRWSVLISISVVGVFSVFLGQYFRHGEVFSVFSEALLRFYFNNQVLYLAIADHEKIYNILMEGQPWVIIDQLFSFAVERTHMPSSFRLLEYWGFEAKPDETGHIAGYAYGWLGLTYGIFGWWGLFVIYATFIVLFKLIRTQIVKPSLMNMCFFIFSGMMLYEFFSNLGLDSYMEKIFKGWLTIILFVIVVKIIEFGVSGQFKNRRMVVSNEVL